MLDGDKTLKVLGIWSLDFLTSLESQGARSIQPKFQPVRPGKVVHLKRWTNLVPRTFLGKSPGDEVEGKPVFSKLFRLDRTDPLTFGPKFWLNWSRPLRIKMDEMIFDFAVAGAGCKRIKDVLYKTLRLSPVNQQSEPNWVHTTQLLQIKTVIYPCFYLLISQLRPVNPSEQLHIGPNEVFMHVPLLEQVVVEQFSDDALSKCINMLIKEN